jgi:hypothetical protein
VGEECGDGALVGQRRGRGGPDEAQRAVDRELGGTEAVRIDLAAVPAG